jgi:hypothetical protein
MNEKNRLSDFFLGWAAGFNLCLFGFVVAIIICATSSNTELLNKIWFWLFIDIGCIFVFGFIGIVVRKNDNDE